MGKQRLTNELIARAEEVFAKAGKEFIPVNVGLNRKELRALERAGIVEKMPSFKTRKYRNVNPSMTYVYRLIRINLKKG